jgi:hypothetical protein
MSEPVGNQSTFRCGAAVRRVRPRDGLWLAGYGRPHSERGRTDGDEALAARAIYVEDAASAALIVVMDLMAGTRRLREGIAARLLADLAEADVSCRLRPEDVLIVGTHTHSAPGRHFGCTLYDRTAQGGWPGYDRRWTAQLVEAGAAAALEAIRGAVPARCGSASAPVWTASPTGPDGSRALGHNRSFEAHRNNPEHAEGAWAVGPGSGAPASHSAVEAAVDPRLRVLALVRDDDPSRLIASFATFACHNACLGPRNTSYHREWNGVAVDLVEAHCGDGAVAALGASAGGDYSALAEAEPSEARVGAAVAQRLGVAVGEAWATLVERARRRAVANVTVGCAHATLRPREDGLAPCVVGASVVRGADEIRSVGVDERARSRRYERARPPHDQQSPKRPAYGLLQGLLRPWLRPHAEHPLSLVRIGDAVLFAMPFEATAVAGWRIERSILDAWPAGSATGAAPRFVSALHHTNDYAGYVTTPEEFEEQQYEGGHTLYGKRTCEVLAQRFAALVPAVAEAGEPRTPPELPHDEVVLRMREAISGHPWLDEALGEARTLLATLEARAGGDLVEVLDGAEATIRRLAEEAPEDTEVVMAEVTQLTKRLRALVEQVTRAMGEAEGDFGRARREAVAGVLGGPRPWPFRNLRLAAAPPRWRRCEAHELSDWIGQELRRGGPAKVAGGGWSFSNVAFTEGSLALPAEEGGLVEWVEPRELLAGSAGRFLWVSAGATFDQVNAVARAQGRALFNQPGFTRLSYVGVMATGGHGSGLGMGPICEQVRAIEVLVAQERGQLRRLRIERSGSRAVSDPARLPGGVELVVDDELFRAAVVGLGLQGVILRVMVETRAAYRVSETRRSTTWEALRGEGLAALCERQRSGALHSAELWINPYPVGGDHTVIVGERAETELPEQGKRPFAVEHGGGEQGRALASAVTGHLPALVPLMLESALAFTVSRELVVMDSAAGLSFAGCNEIEVLSAGFDVDLRVVEEAVETVMGEADAWRRAREPRYLTSPVGVRFIGKTDAWLAPQFDRDTAMIEVPLLVETEHKEDILTELLELVAQKHGARPHWGQYNPLPGSVLRSLYDAACWDAFRRARLRLDPLRSGDGPFSEQLGL